MAAAPPLPSERSFGITFAALFALAGGWLAWRIDARWAVLLLPAALFIVLAFTASKALRPLNRAWMKLAQVLHQIVSPIVLGIVYFGVFTPTALVMRLRGRDALERAFDRSLSSYWKAREPPGPDAQRSFPRQF